MATTKEIVELLFNADYRGQPEMQKLKKDLTSLGDDLSSGVSAVAAFSTALLGLEAAAIATSIGLARSGVDAAGKFNDQFNEISTLVELTSDDLDAFKKGIQSYASESTASIETINGAIYNAISAGVDWSKSIEFVSNAEKLSVAGKADLNSVVQVLTGSLNAYGVSVDEAGAYSDILFNTVKNGVTTIPELASSLGQVTGLAASLNIPFDELNSIIATLTANGLSTGNAITAIKGALTGIIKPTKDASEAASELGIGFDYSALQSKGFAGLMQEIADKAGNNREAVTKLFGSVEGLNAALSLTSEQGAQTFVDKLKAIEDSAGATDGAFEKMKNNAELVKQTLQNNIQLTLGAIGEPLLDEFKDMDKAITSIFASVRQSLESDKGLGVVIDAVEDVAKTVSSIITNMANNMDDALAKADLSGFTDAFRLLDGAINGLDLATPEGLAKAIESVGKAFESLTQFSVSAGSVLKDLLSLFGGLVNVLSHVDTDAIAVAGAIGGTAIAIAAVTTVLGPFLAVLKALKDMGGVAGAIGDAGKVNKTASAVSAIGGAIQKLGVAGAAAGAGFFAGGWLAEGIDKLTGWSAEASKSTVAGAELTKMLEQFRAETGNANATMDDYANHLRAKRAAENDGVQSVDKLTEAQSNLDQQMSNADFKAIDDLKKMGEVTLDASGNIVSFSTDVENANSKVKAISGDVKAFGEVTKSTGEKLKTIESFKPVFDFQIAKVKSESEQVKSIMDALGTSSKAVGDSLGASLGIFSSGEFSKLNVFDQTDIMSVVKQQAEAQTELATAQANIANAKADYLRSQSSALNSGNALIQIDGTRLEPQLEAFMMEILKAIQVKMAQQQADFLLGVNPL